MPERRRRRGRRSRGSAPSTSRTRPSRAAAGSRGSRPATGAKGQFVIPYDYGATFELQGRPGNLLQGVINTSVEGMFVATAIGYGLEEDRGRPTAATEGLPQVALEGQFRPDRVRLRNFPVESLVSGLRVAPRQQRLAFESTTGNVESLQPRDLRVSSQPLPGDRAGTGQGGYRRRLFERVVPAADLSFMFSMVDSATGRELQDEPTHNIASLGKSNGERPFRRLARPLAFEPRSTVRLQVTELSEGVRGTLFIVLYGYKVLDLATCSESAVRQLAALQNGSKPAKTPPGSRLIPFDYVAGVNLTGTRDNLLEDEIIVNVDGGFVATSIGYGLAPDARSRTLSLGLDPNGPPQDLGVLQLDQLPVEALIDGFRFRPELLRAALQPGGGLATVPARLANEIFESLNRPEDVSFRYSISDTGTGRDLQNLDLHNVAGLGIANGDRPFKSLARPMTFLPRSKIRVRVREHRGRGRLYIVFQGYKLLGG